MHKGIRAGLDPTRISALAEDLGNPVYALNFLGDFLCMLPGRIERIRRNLQNQDGKAALDAVLSLKVTAAMTGAVETEARCSTIEMLLRTNRFQEAGTAAASLNLLIDTLITRGPDLLIEAKQNCATANRS